MQRVASIARHVCAGAVAAAESQDDVATDELPTSPYHGLDLFEGGAVTLSQAQKDQMDSDGHLVLPGILTADAIDRLRKGVL